MSLTDRSVFSLVILNNKYLILEIDKLSNNKIKEVVLELIQNKNNNLYLREDISIYEVIDEYKAKASTMYYSDGLARKTYVTSQQHEFVKQEIQCNPINYEIVVVAPIYNEIVEIMISPGKQKLMKYFYAMLFIGTAFVG